jgi:hypothetical protein
MTDSNNLNQLRQLKKNGIGTIDVQAIAIDKAIERNAASALIKPTDDAATRAFLTYYEAFLGAPDNDQILWQSQEFYGSQEERPPTLWSRPLMKVGVVGGGLATLAISGALVPRETVQSVTAAARKLIAAQPKASTPRAKASVASKFNSIAPASSIAEFSNSSTASIPKVQVPRVVSPAIRAPLPGQVISRQTVEVGSGSHSAGLKGMTAPSTQNKQGRPAASPNASNSLIANRQPNSPTARNSGLPSLASPALLDSLASKQLSTTVPQPSDSLSALTFQDNAQPKPSSQASTSTPMPPTEETKTFLPSIGAGSATQNAKPSEVVRLLPTLAASMILQNAGRSPTASLNLPQTAPNATSAAKTKNLLEVKQKAISGTLSQPLNQAINSAQTIQDFLKLSQKIPTSASVAIVSLTLQAAIAVPNSGQLESFQVFRLPSVTYQKAWLALTQRVERSDSAPQYGFIDYQQRAIVLPSS